MPTTCNWCSSENVGVDLPAAEVACSIQQRFRHWIPDAGLEFPIIQSNSIMVWKLRLGSETNEIWMDQLLMSERPRVSSPRIVVGTFRYPSSKRFLFFLLSMGCVHCYYCEDSKNEIAGLVRCGNYPECKFSIIELSFDETDSSTKRTNTSLTFGRWSKLLRTFRRTCIGKMSMKFGSDCTPCSKHCVCKGRWRLCTMHSNRIVKGILTIKNLTCGGYFTTHNDILQLLQWYLDVFIKCTVVKYAFRVRVQVSSIKEHELFIGKTTALQLFWKSNSLTK